MKFSISCSHAFGAIMLMISNPVAVIGQCTDVHIVFARGSGEMPGLGICGTPFVSRITSQLAGKSVSSYAVEYSASISQTSAGPGATDMTKHVVGVAQECPNTVFVLGGYSQGASVTDIAIGISTSLGVGEYIPDTLAPRQSIESSSQLYGSKAIEHCNLGDPVCGNGFNTIAHMTYPTDGSVDKAASQAAALAQGGGNSLRG
ncbi:putative cutinase/acetylxylan esterase, alpha/Beta hydrolase [Plasmopara halstedii]